jgi:tRNA pseudouridine(55) synthase
MRRFVVLEKKVGETPLEAVGIWKKTHPSYEHIPTSYAGRLDPMASGKLLVLIGEECKKQKEYTHLDKEYVVEVLLDVGSDTGDALGLTYDAHKESTFDAGVLRRALAQERGTHVRAYPVFSSKTVDGKPLFLHALEGALEKIVIPTHEEHIHSISHTYTDSLTSAQLESRIETYLSVVPVSKEPSKVFGADFRIEQVRRSWRSIFNRNAGRTFTVLTFRVVCGKGTYMRTLAGRIGEALGTKGLALSIRRTKIGKYWNGLWVREF